MRKFQPNFLSRPWKRRWKFIGIGTFFLVALWIGVSVYFRLTPIGLINNGIRVAASPIFAQLYNEDQKNVAALCKRNWCGITALALSSPLENWQRIESKLVGFKFAGGNGSEEIIKDIPFVYESMNAPHLVEFRNLYRLNELVANIPDEYTAMLQLGAWVGSLWDHGISPVPGGTQTFNPVDVIQAGRDGSKFWCEIAAKMTVHAATAVGWTSRLLTASGDGYTWEHAVTELWSNQYNKWFVMDTDFNVVYEKGGIPLSAFELCHDGPELQKTGYLQIRAIAPPKPSLPLMDLIPFYRYIHIDLRNDWNTRRLRRGSPVGGDLATWWTARPSLGHVLTAKIRVDAPERFNWPVNVINIHALGVDFSPGGAPVLHIGLIGYSPSFETFQVSTDDGPWHEIPSGKFSFPLLSGKHAIRAHILTEGNWKGPIYEVQFQLS